MSDAVVSRAWPETGSVDEVSAIVGRNLRRLRTQKGHSLERLASISGVSRAMLGQIETGKSTPTIALLGRIATALGIPIATLIAGPQTAGTVILRKDREKVLTSSDGRFSSRALFPFDAGHSAEFYELRIAAHHTEQAERRAAGTRENVVVNRGAVEITVGQDRPVLLSEGDAMVFMADVTHSYRNVSPGEAVLYLVTTLSDG